MNLLPDDILYQIFSELRLPDLCLLSIVNNNWKRILITILEEKNEGDYLNYLNAMRISFKSSSTFLKFTRKYLCCNEKWYHSYPGYMFESVEANDNCITWGIQYRCCAFTKCGSRCWRQPSRSSCINMCWYHNKMFKEKNSSNNFL